MTAALQKRRRSDLYRQRIRLSSVQSHRVNADGQSLLNFSSNDYLGLSARPLSAHSVGSGSGSGASSLVCGHHQAHSELETALAKAVGYPKALLFSNGYMANLALIQALCQKGDLVLQDKLNHASLIDAGVLSRAQSKRYGHLNYAQAKHIIEIMDCNTGLLVTDAVFSMDGDQADLPLLSELAQQHDLGLMIDDAHGFGCLINDVNGQTLTGSSAHHGLNNQAVPIYMGTLGKALGGYGAFIAGDEDLIDYLIQFARPYIYTTALPPLIAHHMLENLEHVMSGERQQKLNANIAQFKQLAKIQALNLMPSDTAIQPWLIGDDALAMQFSHALKQQGILVTAIRPPTVPKGSARLRITLTASHTEEEINSLVLAMGTIAEAHGDQ